MTEYEEEYEEAETQDDDTEPQDEDTKLLADALSHAVLRTAMSHGPTLGSGPQPPEQAPSRPAERKALPDLELVQPKRADRVGRPSQRGASGVGGSGGGGYWAPRTQQERDRDSELT